jgi:hypothetical protein
LTPEDSSTNTPQWTQTCLGKKLVRFRVVDNKRILNPSLLAQVLLSGALTAGAVALYFSARAEINRLSDDWRVCAAISQGVNTRNTNGIQTALPSLETISTNINGLGAINGKDPVLPSQKNRLQDQLKQLDLAQKTACRIGVFFFANRNAALTVSTAASILVITSLAFVSKKGWEETNNIIINIGVTSGLILFTIWTYSQLYGQGINYESHRVKYALATDLINSVASAAANHTAIGFQDGSSGSPAATLNLNTSTGMATLIRTLDSKLEVLNKPEFTGDTSFAEGSVNRIGGLLNTPPKEPKPSQVPNNPGPGK